MKNLTDPVANSKTIGFLYIILGVLTLLGAFSDPMHALFGVVYLVTGWV